MPYVHSNDKEKPEEILIEECPEGTNSLMKDGDHAVASALDTENLLSEERSLVRKIDMWLLPTVFLIWIMNYIDRTALTTARLQGLEQDLNLSDIQYDTVVAILYASYCPIQIPSNMLLNRVPRPSLFIGSCVIIWGLISALTGITQNFVGILLCRIFIGIPEAAFFPGALFLLSRWYTRKELAFRTSILYSGFLLSTAFGSLLAAGILSGMEGKRGIRGWRWLYFIEGSATICLGLFSIWALPDYPSNTKWLTPAECRLAQARLADDAREADQDQPEDSLWQGVKLALLDIKVWIFTVSFFAALLGLSFINFFPTLTATLGFNTTISLVLAAPPWIYCTTMSLVNAFHADKTGERLYHIVVHWALVIVGYIISLSSSSTGARYFSMFLMASGYSGSCVLLVWVSNTITRPPAKRAAALGIVNGLGNFANLVGSFAWKASWGPEYHQSMIIGICALAFSSSLAILMRRLLVQENRRMDQSEMGALKGANRQRIEEYARLQGLTVDAALERNRGFRYLY